jgi:cation diffusion facilitator CzcD-associated flavoprotein CzcO
VRRSRWDSLRLFTSGRYDNLPGLPFPAAADAYPGKDDVTEYLQAYAAQFRLPVRLNTAVTSLTRTDGVYVAKAGDWVATCGRGQRLFTWIESPRGLASVNACASGIRSPAPGQDGSPAVTQYSSVPV